MTPEEHFAAAIREVVKEERKRCLALIQDHLVGHGIHCQEAISCQDCLKAIGAPSPVPRASKRSGRSAKK